MHKPSRRMRVLATGLLMTMAAAFLCLRGFRLDTIHPAWGFATAFTEAAMVGALADWFAVTALFRRPLGLPIPHTAIIPDNKDRIADNMAAFLRDNFLTPSVVARRLGDFDLAQNIGEFLTAERSGRISQTSGGAASLFAEVLESLDPAVLGLKVRAGLASQISKLQIAPLLGEILEAIIAEERHLPLIDRLIEWGGAMIRDNEPLIREIIRARANVLLRWTGLDAKLADSILNGVYKILGDIMADPNHPLRGKLTAGLTKLAHDLIHDDKTRAKVEAVKLQIINDPAVTHWWQGVWERFRLSLIASARNPGSELSGQIRAAMGDIGAALCSDPVLQDHVNRFARRNIAGLVSRYGNEIVRLVSVTVKRWDARTITDRIEDAVGRDLQFIRINGTLVGGLIGIIIHTFDVLVF